MTDLLAYIEDNSCHSIASPFVKRSGLCWLFKCDTIQKKIVITLIFKTHIKNHHIKPYYNEFIIYTVAINEKCYPYFLNSCGIVSCSSGNNTNNRSSNIIKQYCYYY